MSLWIVKYRFTTTVHKNKISRLAKKNKSWANHIASKSSKRTDDEHWSAKRIQDVKLGQKKSHNDLWVSSNTSQTGILSHNFNQTVSKKKDRLATKYSSRSNNKAKSDFMTKGTKGSTWKEQLKSPFETQAKIAENHPDRSKKIKGILKVHSRKPSELATNWKTFYNSETTRNELRHSKSKKSIGYLNLESVSYVSPKDKTEFKLKTPNSILNNDIILNLNKQFESVSNISNTKKYQQYKAKVNQLRSWRSKEKLAEPVWKSFKTKASISKLFQFNSWRLLFNAI